MPQTSLDDHLSEREAALLAAAGVTAGDLAQWLWDHVSATWQ